MTNSILTAVAVILVSGTVFVWALAKALKDLEPDDWDKY